MKKILFLLAFFSTALLGMDKDMYFKKGSCNLGYGGARLVHDDYECQYSREELFSGEQAIASVAYDKNHCELKFLYVLPEFQQNGLGKLLFFKAIADMKNVGCKRVTWFSTYNAQPFYTKLGAKQNSPCNMYIDTDTEKNKKNEFQIH